MQHYLQEGETCVHYAAETTKSHAHHEFEDTDIIKMLLDHDGDINICTRLVGAQQAQGIVKEH